MTTRGRSAASLAVLLLARPTLSACRSGSPPDTVVVSTGTGSDKPPPTFSQEQCGGTYVHYFPSACPSAVVSPSP